MRPRRTFSFSPLLFPILFLTLLLPLPARASSKRAESLLLPNGLKVVLAKDFSTPLVALQLWVKTGAADEAPEESGLAHLLEHILFRGSSRRGTGKLVSEIEGLGGSINGTTTHEETVYHLVLPTSHLKTGLQVLAEMMRLPSFDETALQAETQVVLEEWKQSEDDPLSKVRAALFDAAYQTHAYGRRVIGTPESLKGITWEALSRFHQRWYTANNMILVVAGNVDSESLKGDLGEIFASLPALELPTRYRSQGPPQVEPRLNVLEGPVRQSHLMIGFHIPSAREEEAPAMDLLAFILGRGESSRLAQRVKIAEGLVTSISASTFAPKESGLFLIEAQMETGRAMEALRAILTEVYRLRRELVSPSELTRAYVNFARAFVEAKETVQGRARQLGRHQSLYDDPNYEEIYLSRIRQLGAEKLRSAAQAFFKTETLSLSLLVPEGTTRRPDTEEISRLSRSLENFSANPLTKQEGGVVKATLENGLRILIRENHRLPMFTIQAGVIGGLILENDINNGIHNFIVSMLTQGTPRLTSSQLVHEIEQLGGTLRGSAGNNVLGLTGTFPSEHADRGLEIFLDVFFHPTFPPEELEKKRREILVKVENRDEEIRHQAFRLFYQGLFRGHPYRLDPGGERDQVSRLSREDLIRHYQKLLSPDRMVLTIVGDVDGNNILKQLRDRLSSLRKDPSSLSLPAAVDGGTDLQAEKKTIKAKQAHLILGFIAPAKGRNEYFTMKVLETILSRIGGRLFVELRDKQGLAYSIGAFSLDDPLQGAFGIYAATDPVHTEKMKEGILREIRRLQVEEVPTHELERAKRLLIGDYLIARLTNASLAADLTFNELFGLGADFGQRYEEGIEKVTAADVLGFARRYLLSDRYVLAVVGP